jgi:dihydrofolate reductase
MQTISIIAAVAENGVIGSGGKLPWNLPADLQRFKKITMGHSVVMGKATCQSIGKPLPDRKNIVLARESDFRPEGCIIADSIEQALSEAGDGEVFFIGGGNVYRQILPRADRLYLTRIHREFPGDVLFPEINLAEWKEVSREEGRVDAKNSIPHTFLVYGRVRK